MADIATWVDQGHRLMQSGELEALQQLVQRIEPEVPELTQEQQRQLRDVVAQWIASASLIRSDCLTQLKQAQTAGDATRTYQSISTAD